MNSRLAKVGIVLTFLLLAMLVIGGWYVWRQDRIADQARADAVAAREAEAQALREATESWREDLLAVVSQIHRESRHANERNDSRHARLVKLTVKIAKRQGTPVQGLTEPALVPRQPAPTGGGGKGGGGGGGGNTPPPPPAPPLPPNTVGESDQCPPNNKHCEGG